jgi:arginine decarboxylase
VITPETVTFMRKLDVKEIHGYNGALGLELLSPKALAALKKDVKKEEKPAAKKERER